jgi:hypothetical protein
MPTARWGSLWAAGALALGCGEPHDRRAESVPPEPLPIAADTIVVPWSSVPEAAWIGARRWVLVGADFNAVSVVDFAARTATPLGGAKNPELANPFAVFAVGDTAFISDWGKRRVSIWSGEGRMVGSIPAPDQLRGVLPKARDAAGNLYYEIPPIAGPDGSGLKESPVVVRSDATMTRFDTLTRLAPLDVAEVSDRGQKRYERLVFGGQDWWGVRPDGRVWVARVRLGLVSTIDDGEERRGERLPDPVLEVTRNDRLQHINTFPEDLRSMAEQLPFAPYRPNFERAFGLPDGTVWIRKSKAAVDSIRRYHVVDTTGTLVRVLTTVGNGLIVAASPEQALLVEQFREGLRVMELRLPAPPPAAAAPTDR